MTSMTVFRVRGIPEELTLGALEKVLAEADKNGNLKIKATIAPSCYDKTQTALVQFDPLPSYLQGAGSAEWGGYDMEVEIEEELFDITIDKDFFGLTQLYPTKSGDITADIVAVTSLAGHAFESWRGKGGLGRMWLRDFLSVDLPNCRTLTYGYDSRLSSAGVHQLRDYNRGFLEELKKARTSEEERERPIIFIGHSFGGIIVAQSLVRSKECNPRDDPAVYAIHQATRGVIFYGTPHRGFLVDDILSTFNLQDYSERVKLLNSINKNSDLLHSELERFVDLAMQLRIVSFYERFQTRRPVQGENGLARTKEYVTTVDTDSALLHLGSAIEKKIPVDADNTEIVKFKNKQSQAYSSTLVYLQEFEKKITTPPSSGTGRGTPWPGMNHGSLEVSKSRSRRSSSTRSDRRGPCVEPVQETQAQIWTGNRGSLMISKGKPMSFYQLVAEPYEPGCGSPSLNLQRVDCKAPPSENPPPEYTPLDQLQNGRERLALKLDSSKSETITALDPELYTPDKKHPYRGIWIAAHSTTDPRATNGHLYEFLLFHQPNEKNLLVTKISGDVNIPRGERSMFSALPDPYSYSSPLVVGVQLQVGDYLIGRSYWIPATLRLLSTSIALLEGYNCTYRRVAIETYMRMVFERHTL